MKLINIKEVSEILDVKESTLYSWVRNNTIPSYKLNGAVRFDLDEIKTWLNESKRKPCDIQLPAPKTVSDQDVQSIIRKAIEDITGKGYNPSNEKPGPNQGLREEG